MAALRPLWASEITSLVPSSPRAFKPRRKSIQKVSDRPGAIQGRHSPKALRPARKRDLVDGMLVEWGVSIRRACRALRLDTSTYHYKSHRTGQAALE